MVSYIIKQVVVCNCRVIEDIQIRLHPSNINRDSEIEIPEAWMPTSPL